MVFSPTYLYIKQHTITGKLYFDKSAKSLDKMLLYKGSGKYWKRHISTHGKAHVVTLWYELYDNIFDLVADALSMSKSFDVVKSASWLNLRIENGLDGGNLFTNHHNKEQYIINQMKSKTEASRKCSITKSSPEWKASHKITDETRLRMSISGKNKPPVTEETRKKQSNSLKGKIHSAESIERGRLARIGKKRRAKTPEECLAIGLRLMGHQHSEETKNKISISHTGKICTEEHKKNIGIASRIRILANGGASNPNNIRICCIACNKETNIPNLSKHLKKCINS